MILKRIAAVAFAIAFLMAIVLFTGTGSDLVPRGIARIVFLAAGALGLVLNLLSFRYGKHDPNFNLIYWLGSIVLFIGLMFLIMRWPFGFYIVLAGMATVGISFFVSPNIDKKEEEESDLLDN